MTPSGIEPATLRFVAQSLNQRRCRVPHTTTSVLMVHHVSTYLIRHNQAIKNVETCCTYTRSCVGSYYKY